MANPFQAAFLINLKRRPDRLASALRILYSPDWPFAAPTIFPAIDGNLVPCPEGWLAGGAAWGCRESHISILRHCIMEQVEPVLILEDDICIRSTFREDCERFFAAVPDDWGCLMLGGQHHSRPQSARTGVVRCTNTQRTHAYAVRGGCLRDLYGLWASPKQTQHIDWTFGEVQRRHPTYAPDPFLFGQDGVYSDIRGRVEARRFWQPPTGNEMVLFLDCDRETMEGLRAFCVHTGHDRGADGIDNGLRLVFQAGDVRQKLRKWLSDLQWECVSTEGMVLGVWHQQATADMVRECWTGPVVVIRSVNDYLDFIWEVML